MSKIAWCDKTINPVVGCTRVSPGCDHCYAVKQAHRLARIGKTKAKYEGLTHVVGGRIEWTGEVNIHRAGAMLAEAAKWKRPRRIFVGSMGDMFHDNVPAGWLYHVFDAMDALRRHTFILSTKRPDNIRNKLYERPSRYFGGGDCLPNAWLGVTAEDQSHADDRVSLLLSVPAAARFVSIEPMLGPVDLSGWLPEENPGPRPYESQTEFIDRLEYEDRQKLAWVIVGGEAHAGARPCHPDWVRSVRDQCVEAGVPFFFKGWGAWLPVSYSFGQEVQRKADHRVHQWPDESWSVKVGAKASTDILDGEQWHQFPEVSHRGAESTEEGGT